jgi:hypothetical protein
VACRTECNPARIFDLSDGSCVGWRNSRQRGTSFYRVLVPTQPTACNVVRRFEENIAVPTSLVGLFALASPLGGRTLSGWLFYLETFNGEHTIQSWLSFSDYTGRTVSRGANMAQGTAVGRTNQTRRDAFY